MAPLDPDRLCRSLQRIHKGLYDGEDLHRLRQGALYTGAELLFLPGGAALLPHRLFADEPEHPAVPGDAVRTRSVDGIRLPDGAIRLRFSMPPRAEPGSFIQEPLCKEAEKTPRGKNPALSPLRGPGAVCDPVSHGPFGRLRGAGSLVLQVYLPRGDPGGRDPAGPFEPSFTPGSW